MKRRINVPGFLSRYAEVLTLDLGDSYWLKHKRHLLRADFEAAQDKLMSATMRITAADEDENQRGTNETTATLNTNAQQNEYVARALTEWNLTDEENALIPLGSCDPAKGPDPVRYAAVRLLPEEVFDKVLGGIEGVSRKKKDVKVEQVADERFRGAGAKGARATAQDGSGS